LSALSKLALLLVLPAMLSAVTAAPAGAVILPAQTLDGPSENIVGFGGVAMAEDGTGGVVYLEREAGVVHVFVSRYLGGHWLAPVRVDTEQPYAASWPRIAAADGGELLVVWATPFASENERPVDELLGAELAPGSSRFSPAVIIDSGLREGNGTSPDIAMSSTGQADVVYRVVTQRQGERSSVPLLRPGDVVEEVRVAHFDGARWSALGAINRNPGASMRAPTQANAPQIAIGPTGNGVVVWQEPESEGVARIWARRIFGTALDYVLPVSTTSYNGVAIGTDADAPSVALSRLGQAEVAYRQSVGPGSPLPGPRIFLNTLPDGESISGAGFAGASIVDTAVAGGANAAVGRPGIDIDEKQDMRLLYDSNGTPRVIEGNDRGLSGTLSLGPAFVGSEGAPASEVGAASVMNPEGGGVSAWPSADTHGAPAVAIREDFPGGGVQTALVSGGAGGAIDELAVGRSGLGDGLVAFQQGPVGDAAIVAAQTTAPPQEFVVSVPKGWVRPSQATISWEQAVSADGPLSYSVILDGRRLPVAAGVDQLRLDPRGLGSGVHKVSLLASEMFGGSTLTPAFDLHVDGQPPTVSVRTHSGGVVSVRVSDTGSGVQAGKVTISFGDGAGAHGLKAYRHRYAHPGTYELVIHVEDRLGNAATLHRLVHAR
jgi:hypothetical protein